MAIDYYPTTPYEGLVHGERIVDGNAATLTALDLYQAGSVTAIASLGAKQFLYITDITICIETAADFSLVADSAAAGRYIAHGALPNTGTLRIHFKTPYCCPAGVIPKFAGSASNRSICIIEGFIRSA